MTIGQILAAAREEAGYSVAELSARTLVREHVIEAIERDDFTSCGANFYARGHVRGLARELGLDPGPLLEKFDAEFGAPAVSPPATSFPAWYETPPARYHRPYWVLIAGVASLVVLFGVVVRALLAAFGPG